ncbi:hypothetical protein KSP40_PGU004696 [Platanthera guangdongensis]|uniref:Uncharacterized protein n=1 Tax=Platanthera guangdongensis TaxID=2320717 RepID=A0ABR2LIT6_9ASPA
MSCPSNAFRYNGSFCSCDPGYWRQPNGSCALFSGGEWVTNSGVSSPSIFLTTVLPLDNIRRFTQSQAVLLEATLAVLLAWLLFCFLLRFAPLHSRRRHPILFRLRWWISRFDFFFSKEHWLEDNKGVVKRKTELGGTFSVASWILFIGLLSALLYQMITRRSIEVHRVIPANAPDLQSFVNDMEFNITTVSSMSCSQLRGLGTMVIGTPGSIGYKVSPLSAYVDYQCQNTSRGPTISLKCVRCQVQRSNHYISWKFVDTPNDPAMAVGFTFNFTTKDHNSMHMNFVSGSLIANRNTSNKSRTFRGFDLNILEIHLFPLIYNNLHDLKLIKPLVHDFVSGSSFSEVGDLQASLLNPNDGLVNTVLHISYLSDYIVAMDKENIMGPVSFLANVGGLYAVSIAIFLYLLVQCEARIKKLHNEDIIMREIRSQIRAQRNWEKLRKYVMYTWHPNMLDVKNNSTGKDSLMIDYCCGSGCSKRKQLSRQDSLSLDQLFENSNTSENANTKDEGRNKQTNISRAVYASQSQSDPL